MIRKISSGFKSIIEHKKEISKKKEIKKGIASAQKAIREIKTAKMSGKATDSDLKSLKVKVRELKENAKPFEKDLELQDAVTHLEDKVKELGEKILSGKRITQKFKKSINRDQNGKIVIKNAADAKTIENLSLKVTNFLLAPESKKDKNLKEIKKIDEQLKDVQSTDTYKKQISKVKSNYQTLKRKALKENSRMIHQMTTLGLQSYEYQEYKYLLSYQDLASYADHVGYTQKQTQDLKIPYIRFYEVPNKKVSDRELKNIFQELKYLNASIEISNHKGDARYTKIEVEEFKAFKKAALGKGGKFKEGLTISYQVKKEEKIQAESLPDKVKAADDKTLESYLNQLKKRTHCTLVTKKQTYDIHDLDVKTFKKLTVEKEAFKKDWTIQIRSSKTPGKEELKEMGIFKKRKKGPLRFTEPVTFRSEGIVEGSDTAWTHLRPFKTVSPGKPKLEVVIHQRPHHQIGVLKDYGHGSIRITTSAGEVFSVGFFPESELAVSSPKDINMGYQKGKLETPDRRDAMGHHTHFIQEYAISSECAHKLLDYIEQKQADLKKDKPIPFHPTRLNCSAFVEEVRDRALEESGTQFTQFRKEEKGKVTDKKVKFSWRKKASYESKKVLAHFALILTSPFSNINRAFETRKDPSKKFDMKELKKRKIEPMKMAGDILYRNPKKPVKDKKD